MLSSVKKYTLFWFKFWKNIQEWINNYSVKWTKGPHEEKGWPAIFEYCIQDM